MGGEGHMMDMNKRLEQNRALRASKNREKSKHSNNVNSARDSQELKFKKVTPEELETIKEDIRKQAKKDRKTNFLLLLGIIVIVSIVFALVSSLVL